MAPRIELLRRDSTKTLGSVANIRSKRRSASYSSFVAVSFRSQMLYPIELRAPEKDS